MANRDFSKNQKQRLLLLHNVLLLLVVMCGLPQGGVGLTTTKSPKNRPPSPQKSYNYGLLGNLIVQVVDGWYYAKTNSDQPRLDSGTAAAVPTPTKEEEESPLFRISAGPAKAAAEEKAGNDSGAMEGNCPSAEDHVDAGVCTAPGAPTDFPARKLDEPRRRLVNSEKRPIARESTMARHDMGRGLEHPAQRLKNLLDPFVLFLMHDDGGLRKAVEKLHAWEAEERRPNENFVTAGVAAL